jgi:hypothetical protein
MATKKREPRSKTFFIAAKGFRVEVVTKNKPLPADAFWSGTDKEEALTQAAERREQRKAFNYEHRGQKRRFANRRERLRKLTGRAAPAFKAYAKGILDEHLAKPPKNYFGEALSA